MEAVQRIDARVQEIRSRIGELTGRSMAPGGATFADQLTAADQMAVTGGSKLVPAGSRPKEQAPSGVDIERFSRDVLTAIGAPPTEANLDLLSAWIKSEGTRARFNPLATTRKAPGATNFNSVGVKNFVSYDQGVATTADVLGLGYYTEVVAALRRGNDPYAVADAIARSPWGTGGLVRTVLESRGVPGA